MAKNTSIKVMERPVLSLWEKSYLPGFFKGLAITLKHALASIFKKGRIVTMQYPEQKWDKNLPDYYRGVPSLVTDEQGRERCVSCQLCEFICPPRAIRIEPGELASDSEWAKVEKAPKNFDIDMTRCIYCGQCEEVCPEEAIFMSKMYSLNAGSREEMLFDKKKLYEIGGERKNLVNKWNEKK